jgi:hypothetical protein
MWQPPQVAPVSPAPGPRRSHRVHQLGELPRHPDEQLTRLGACHNRVMDVVSSRVVMVVGSS